ncbi:MAG TPA: hypothetical protein PKD83_08090, partial [Ignavibacteria bacterium]|nr:hypothetical protein [Ignavibacteria bacterium]
MMKKILIFLIPIVLVFAYGFKPHDQPVNNQKNKNGIIPYNNSNNPNQVMNLSSVQLQANQINTWFRNNGSFNRNPATDNSGFEWPKGSAKFARYASGLWIGAQVGNDTLVCIAEFSYEYVGGNIPVLGGPPQGQGDPNFKIYNISPTDTSEYQAWRTFAASQGAYLDSNGNPYLLGDQTQFYSYTDGYASAHGNRAGSTLPLGAVILQTNWSYAANGPLSSMAFSEFRVINRSNSTWNNTYIAVWTDDDVGDGTNDAIGCDTALGLGFTYNASNSDNQYGAAPPAV